MVLALAKKELQCQKLYRQMLMICLASMSQLLLSRYMRGSRNVFSLKKVQEFTSLYEALKDTTDSIVQEKIIGDEYTVQMIASPRSELVAILPIKVREKRGVQFRQPWLKTCQLFNIARVFTMLSSQMDVTTFNL